MSTRPRASSARLRVIKDGGDDDPLSPEARKIVVDTARQARLRVRKSELLDVLTGEKPLPPTEEERLAFVRETMILSIYALRLDLMARGGREYARHRRQAALQACRTGEKLLGLAGAGAVRRSRGLTPTGLPPTEHLGHTAAMRAIEQAQGTYVPPSDEDVE